MDKSSRVALLVLAGIIAVVIILQSLVWFKDNNKTIVKVPYEITITQTLTITSTEFLDSSPDFFEGLNALSDVFSDPLVSNLRDRIQDEFDKNYQIIGGLQYKNFVLYLVTTPYGGFEYVYRWDGKKWVFHGRECRVSCKPLGIGG